MHAGLKHLVARWRAAWRRFLVEDPLTPAQVLYLVAITVVLMAFGPPLWASFTGWAVVVDGRAVAVCPSLSLARQALEEKFYLGEGRDLAQRVTVRRASAVEGPQVFQAKQLVNLLGEALGTTGRGTALVVDGKVRLVVADAAEARSLLEDVVEAFRPAGGKAWLAGSVGLEEVRVPPALVLGREQALEALLSAVRRGELAVLAEGRVSEKREIPFGVEQRRDGSLLRGYTKIVEAGRPGVEEITYRVRYLNGREVGREELARHILQEPRSRVVAVGTRSLLASRAGDGSLAWPAAGSVSSPFGWRWGRLHSGIDITAPYGSPVRAAESGWVVRAGWNGGYGLEVEISHGEGVVTRYAHLSRIEVSPGQPVERGQVIGRVGSTGSATGPHLHFEVWVGGQAVNPMRFF
ncbi:M23 family metallopeptidase [Desulfovirgula thermocuniculi]|uniref:M23 family metallopeptidase n=1 Tax=Desulfovirgula thermocuniculi TaxID=348842 RepID=UPI00041CDB14|nr:peptidoglycan DD-metalloendopeptidase family protein [Desulfovirgula thermocuniculi]